MSSIDMRWSATSSRRHRASYVARTAASGVGPAGVDGVGGAAMPVSRAWPMPSPVIGSVAAAASPTNSVRPRGQDGMSSMRAGMGQARCGDSARASGPSTSAMWGRASSSGHSALHVLDRAALPPRWIPKPTLAPPPGSGNDQA